MKRKPDGAHWRVYRSVRLCAKDFLPPRACARAPRAADLLRCAATGVTPHSYLPDLICLLSVALMAHAQHTTAGSIQLLNYHGSTLEMAIFLIASRRVSSTSSITGRTKYLQ